MVDKKDVIGVFTGHDHQNDFIGLERKIALGYGRVSGYDAYGALKPGARIIELYEDLFKFDTWIATNEGNCDYFYYPSGLSSKDEEQFKSNDQLFLFNPYKMAFLIAITKEI